MRSAECLLCSTSLVFVASALVVYVGPAAASSGVPEMMAFLNGVHLPKVFNIKTLLVKFLSCALSVGSGLPVGPEGPMIHVVRRICTCNASGCDQSRLEKQSHRLVVCTC